MTTIMSGILVRRPNYLHPGGRDEDEAAERETDTGSSLEAMASHLVALPLTVVSSLIINAL